MLKDHLRLADHQFHEKLIITGSLWNGQNKLPIYQVAAAFIHTEFIETRAESPSKIIWYMMAEGMIIAPYDMLHTVFI